MKLNRKMFLMGDMVDVHKCDMCGRESDKGEFGWPGHFYWTDKDFTLCYSCVVELYDSISSASSDTEPVTTANKSPISSQLRWEVWERDNFTCQYCGARQNLTVDHIYPESKGGETELGNLQTLCKSCNSKKGTKN